MTDRNFTIPKELEPYADRALKELNIEHEKIGGKPLDGSQYWPDELITYNGSIEDNRQYTLYKLRTNHTLSVCIGVLIERFKNQTLHTLQE